MHPELKLELTTCGLEQWPKDFRDQFWAVYPRRIGKNLAMRKLDAIRRSGKVAFREIMDAIDVLRRETQNTEMRFIPHPSTWLNQGRWEDDPAAIAGRPSDRRGEIRNGFLARLR